MMKIYFWENLNKIEQQKILERPELSVNETIKKTTKEIIEQIRLNGDNELIALTKKYDGAQLKNLQVSADEFDAAETLINVDARQAIDFAKTQIESYHQSQLPKIQKININEGVSCERQPRPIERVGLYIPGGSAPLVSTVLMLAIPAKIANCPLRVLCTPPNQQSKIDPHLLVAAKLCGIQYVYKVGGAQAIAAMAYGTESIPKVDKIFGPGNAWVTQAKMMVAQDPAGASIDMPAGPSELMVIADDNANHEYVAADLLSQAEHGANSQVMLITFSEQFATKVKNSVQLQLEVLPRKEIAKKSLMQSRIIVVNSIEQAISISNNYAPEHLILQIALPQNYVSYIKNAGAVFLGPWSPETIGDYVSGSNHVLPTYGYARSVSGLSVTDFMKFISFQMVTKNGLKEIGGFAERLAELEGLHAHKNAVTLRLAGMITNNG
jgi:histidinol dehydrogenase